MRLRTIDANECSVCDCSTVIFEKISKKKVDKEGNSIEYRQFACGQLISTGKYKFEPKIVKECPRKAELEEERQKRTKAREDVLTFISSLNTDDNFKSGLTSAIHTISIYY